MDQEKKESLKINPIYIAIFLIFILIIVGISIYIRYSSSDKENRNLNDFIVEFKNTINKYYNTGTTFNEKLNLNVPLEIKEICFVNPNEDINENVDADLENLLKNNKNYNMFLLPIKSFKVAYYRIPNLIVLEKNPLCIKTNGKLKAYVGIIDYKNKKNIELYLVPKSIENVENETIIENQTIIQNNTNINQCTGLCKPNSCDNYDTCMSITGDCTQGYCCYGTCTEKQNVIENITTSETNITICQNAANVSLCSGLNLAYGTGYSSKCCSEFGLCC